MGIIEKFSVLLEQVGVTLAVVSGGKNGEDFLPIFSKLLLFYTAFSNNSTLFHDDGTALSVGVRKLGNESFNIDHFSQCPVHFAHCLTRSFVNLLIVKKKNKFFCTRFERRRFSEFCFF